jgi:uncharacterized protein (DUF2249 family)
MRGMHAKTNPDPVDLDLRHLSAPEPMRRILEALATLEPGQALRARTPCRPVPLLELLENEGWRVEVEVAATGDARVTIVAGDGRAGA